MVTTAPQFAMLAGDCPRCGQTKTTFEIRSAFNIGDSGGWDLYEAFLICRRCLRPSIGLLEEKVTKPEGPASLLGQFANWAFNFQHWVFQVPNRRKTPASVPVPIAKIFEEAATCAAIGAWDASGTMFRKVLDSATRSIILTPDAADRNAAPNWKTYKDLRLRLNWLFEHQLLNPALQDLSSCIHEDGNDAAHDVTGVGEAEAQDLGDFCEIVLETLYTLPGQIAENRRRRDHRREVSINQPAETA